MASSNKATSQSSSSSATQSSSVTNSSSSLSLPSTKPIEESDDYQQEVIEREWGRLSPVVATKFQHVNLSGEEDITFGRHPRCSLMFDKEKHNISNTEFLNISKMHFSIKKTGDRVVIRNQSSNGTFLDGHFLKKSTNYPLGHLSYISIGKPSNKVFQYIDTKAMQTEEENTPVGFTEKYCLLHNIVLGRGATGEVKKCYSREFPSQYYAVKILKKGKSFQAVKDFCYESNILRSIEHPNVVQVIDSYENSYVLFMVMELVEGGELFDFVTSNGPVTEEKCKTYFKQLVDGVSYLHSKGVTHRDLKPENILLNDAKEPTVFKITDFGLSRFVSEQSLMQTMVGTRNYLAPEIVLRKGYTKIVDAWSLGCILFIMLGGYPPFSGGDGGEDALYDAIIKGKCCFHEERWSHISDCAKDLVKKFLTVDPMKRIGVTECLQHEWFNNPLSEPAVKKQKLNH